MSAVEHLVGQAVLMMVSDPWDFGTELGCGPFHGRIVDLKSEVLPGLSGSPRMERALIQLVLPFEYKGVHCEFLVASPRHAGHPLSDLRTHESVSMNLYRTPANRLGALDAGPPPEPTFGLIGSLQMPAVSAAG